MGEPIENGHAEVSDEVKEKAESIKNDANQFFKSE